MTGKYSSYRKPSMLGRFFRLVFSVVVLSSLVLGITLGIKSLSNTDAETLVLMTKPLLAKLHINVDEKKVGDVAGKFVERISETNLGSGVSTSRVGSGTDSDVLAGSNKELLFHVAIMSDVHEDTQNLEKALKMAKSEGVGTVFLLGDATNYGDVVTLQKVKNVLDNSGLYYYVLPGDHDIAQTSSVANFKQVFGPDDQVVTVGGYKFLLLNNSYNFTKITPDQIVWLENNTAGADFMLLAQPLYTTGLTAFFEKIYMGSSSTEVEEQSKILAQGDVRDQGISILNLIRSEAKIKAVFAGEHHKSSKLVDATRASLSHYIVGAISNTVNEYPQSIIQTPRFSVLSVFKDQTYQVDDVVLN